MFKHDDIWRGIDRLANSSGYSPSGLAKQAGLDPTSFNKSKRTSPDGKPRWPSTESLSKVLAVTEATMSDFIALIGLDDDIPKTQNLIPVIGIAKAGEDGYFDADGTPSGDDWNTIPFPQDKSDDTIFALEVDGDSMEPLFRKGDTLVVSTAATIKKGDRVIVKTRDGEVLAKELLKQSTKAITLKSLNPAYEDRILPNEDTDFLAKIIWIGQ